MFRRLNLLDVILYLTRAYRLRSKSVFINCVFSNNVSSKNIYLQCFDTDNWTQEGHPVCKNPAAATPYGFLERPVGHATLTVMIMENRPARLTKALCVCVFIWKRPIMIHTNTEMFEKLLHIAKSFHVC